MGVLRFNSFLLRKFAGFRGIFQATFVILMFPIGFNRDFRSPPIFPNITYNWGWNIPTDDCAAKYQLEIDLSVFSLIGNPRKDKTGQNLTIFYIDRLGLYPHIDANNDTFHGAVPQNASIQDHLAQAKTDIFFYMPTDDLGLAVIDWEEWRPLWVRNWRPKDIYRQVSIELVKKNSPNITDRVASNKAKVDFETAAKNFMLESIKLGKSLRPTYIWGFYLFPDCYNHHYYKPNYDGKCLDLEKKRNDELLWLWRETNVLYPSIYLNNKLRAAQIAKYFSRNRVLEAVRISVVQQGFQNPRPIFVYVRPVFTDAIGEYLSQIDLVNTIGESIALGVNGVVMWGGLNLTQDEQSCRSLNDYMKTILIPYIINVTLAAKMCNQVLCYDKGFCTRKDTDSEDYLHLNSMNFYIGLDHCGRFIVHGEPTASDLLVFIEKFHCSCFSNVTCKERDDLGTLENINVCVNDQICMQAYINFTNKVSHYKWRRTHYKSSSNTSSTLPATMSPCTSGKDFSKCLKVRCPLETFSSNAQEDCQSYNWKNTSSHSHMRKKVNEATYSRTTSIFIKFPAHIFYIFAYTVLSRIS